MQSEGWRQDVEIVRELIVWQKLGPYDPTPETPLELDLSVQVFVQAYEYALGRTIMFVQREQERGTAYEEAMQNELLAIEEALAERSIWAQTATAIAWCALCDAQDLYDPDMPYPTV